MEELTQDERVRLNALIGHLDSFPMGELIAVSGDLRLERPIDETGKKRHRQVLAGAHAVGKITSYLHALRQVDSNREQLGRHIYELLQSAKQLREVDVRASVTSDVHATFNSGLQEVTFHLFAVCVMAIDGLLPLVARATSHKIPKADKAVLESYKPLRDYFEHMEERAPGKTHQEEVVTETQDDHEWRVQSAFQTDDHERVIINGRPVDVTGRGLRVVEEVLGRNYTAMRESCLEQVRSHFEKHPHEIPSPGDVPYKPLVTVFSAVDGESEKDAE